MAPSPDDARAADQRDPDERQPDDRTPADERNGADDDTVRRSEIGEVLREVVSESAHGAPNLGGAVGDIFSTDEVFRRITVTAEEEFSRSTRLLFLSGLAAGLTMSLSFLGKAALAGTLPSDPSGLISNLLYPIGFVFIVVGRYQLFTENTLTPVTLVLTRLASIPRLLRIWGLVFAANVLGALLAAFFFARTNVLEDGMMEAAHHIGMHFFDFTWTELFFKGIIAGWLVAGMVWLTHAVRESSARVLIIFLLIYLVPTARLAHCIVGAVETGYVLFTGAIGLGDYLWHFLLPTTLGNTAGGVILVALLNYGQTRDECFPDRPVLSWRAWLLGADGENEEAPSDM